MAALEHVLVLALVALATLGAWTLLGDALDEHVDCAATAIRGADGAPCAPRPRARSGEHEAAAARGIDLAALVPGLPRSVIDALRDQGTRVVVARGGIGIARPDLASERPRGWPAGSTFGRDALGVYDPARDEIVLAASGDGGGPFSRAYIAAHEIGHAIDLPRGLSFTRDFVRAYERSGLDDLSRAALEETFADSFAMFVTERSSQRARWPALERYWAEHVGDLGAASPSLLARAGSVLRPFGWDDLNPVNLVEKLIDDPLGTALRVITPAPIQLALDATGHDDAPARLVEGGVAAVREAGEGLLDLGVSTTVSILDSLRGSYEVTRGNYTGSTAARTVDPYARATAAAFEHVGKVATRAMGGDPLDMVEGMLVATGSDLADVFSFDPYRMGHGLAALGMTFTRSGATRGLTRSLALGGRIAKVRRATSEADLIASRLVRAQGKGGDRQMRWAQRQISTLPIQTLRRIQASGAELRVGRDHVAEMLPWLDSRGPPRGWPHGSTWSDVSGTAYQGNAYVAPGRSPALSRFLRGSPRRTLDHEIGHTLDRAAGDLSHGAAFEAHYARTRFRASDTYFTQSGVAGREEAFAESFALHVRSPASLERRWPELAAYWRTDPLSVLDSPLRRAPRRPDEAPRIWERGWDAADGLAPAPPRSTTAGEHVRSRSRDLPRRGAADERPAGRIRPRRARFRARVRRARGARRAAQRRQVRQVDGRALSPRRASRVGPRRGHESGTFAQNLSNKLGADVIAPSRALWVLDEDRLVIGWIYPTFDIRGEWRRFRPDPSWRGVHEP